MRWGLSHKIWNRSWLRDRHLLRNESWDEVWVIKFETDHDVWVMNLRQSTTMFDQIQARNFTLMFIVHFLDSFLSFSVSSLEKYFLQWCTSLFLTYIIFFDVHKFRCTSWFSMYIITDSESDDSLMTTLVRWILFPRVLSLDRIMQKLNVYWREHSSRKYTLKMI